MCSLCPTHSPHSAHVHIGAVAHQDVLHHHLPHLVSSCCGNSRMKSLPPATSPAITPSSMSTEGCGSGRLWYSFAARLSSLVVLPRPRLVWQASRPASVVGEKRGTESCRNCAQQQSTSCQCHMVTAAQSCVGCWYYGGAKLHWLLVAVCKQCVTAFAGCTCMVPCMVPPYGALL